MADDCAAPFANAKGAVLLKQKKPRVALVSHFPEDPDRPRGGVESVTVILAQALATLEELEVHVVTVDRGRESEDVSEWSGVTVHRLPARYKNLLTYAVGAGRRQVQKYLRKLQPDVVHAHDTYGLMVKGLDIPRVFTIHGFIHEDTAYAGEHFSWLRSALWRWFETAGWAEQPHIISISPYVRERLRGLTDATIHDIENPVGEEFFHIKRKPANSTIFTAGAICERKNTLGLLEAIGQLKAAGVRVQLNVAGEASNADYARRVRDFISANDLSANVKLLGSLDSAAVREQLSVASAFALLSFEEGAPMGVAEAMAAGVPVVASNRCGMPYMVRDGETGFLVNPNDPAEVARRLKELLENPDLNAEMSKKSTSTAADRHHPTSVAGRAARIYNRISNGRLVQQGTS